LRWEHAKSDRIHAVRRKAAFGDYHPGTTDGAKESVRLLNVAITPVRGFRV
jgi:hypothetical protein